MTSHVKADWKHAKLFHAFWWVKTTHDKDEATMKLIKVQVSEFKIPAYENIKALKPWDPLFVYVPELQLRRSLAARRLARHNHV